jgi:hypothetical protein
MAEVNKEIKLYKLVVNIASGCGWVLGNKFFAWVSHSDFPEFVKCLRDIAGISQDRGFEIYVRNDDTVFDLTSILEDFDIDLESVFPREEYEK